MIFGNKMSFADLIFVYNLSHRTQCYSHKRLWIFALSSLWSKSLSLQAYILDISIVTWKNVLRYICWHWNGYCLPTHHSHGHFTDILDISIVTWKNVLRYICWHWNGYCLPTHHSHGHWKPHVCTNFRLYRTKKLLILR